MPGMPQSISHGKLASVLAAKIARHAVFQVALTILISCVATYVTTIGDVRSPANLIWMLLAPLLIGLVLNKQPHRRATMPVVLIILSIISATAFTFVFWGGY